MTVDTNLRVDKKKVQIIMADKCIDPYAVCSKAGFSYSTYRSLLNKGSGKISTIGKLAKALEVPVIEILTDE